MASNFNSPSRSPGSMRLQLGAVSRLRSSSIKKPPEPLRRAVADSLSASSSSSSVSALSSHYHCNPSVMAFEASRSLRDYLAVPSTTDLAYCVILEHTLAERDRSPAVVGRCVGLLKRYLLRYKPSEETLLQIDWFCLCIIAECDVGLDRSFLPWSHSLNQQSGCAKVSTNSSKSLPVSSFASVALVQSLNYVRSLVARHIPKRSFQPATFSGAPPASRQFLPSLSSLLSRSFNSHLSPANKGESSERKGATLSILDQSNSERFVGTNGHECIAFDVLKSRWHDQHSTATSTDGDQNVKSQDLTRPSLPEVGAASLLVSDMEIRTGGQLSRHFGTADMPYLDQLLHPSSISTGNDSASASHHLRTITASKRAKSVSHKKWDSSSVGTFRPRARQLFQYRHYSEQQPLRLNPAEIGEVITAVCSETFLPNSNLVTISGLSSNHGKPSIDVVVSVLVKLVIDMYVLNSHSAAPLFLSMLEEMVSSPRLSSRTRAFDLILNLAVHAHLLEPVVPDDVSIIEEDYSQDPFFKNEAKLGKQRKRSDSCNKIGSISAIDNFETWILNILYEILVLLVQIEEKEESVWASALSCLLYFVCDRGKIQRSRLKGLDIRVMRTLIEVSRLSSWAEAVHSKLISMLTNMFYESPDEFSSVLSSAPVFLADQIDLIGGMDFIFLEYALAKTREERRNLYLLLFDYVLHQINSSSIAAGALEYGNDEIQPIATLLSLANAPEAFHISVKFGVQGIGEILRRSVCVALSRYPGSEQLNILLEKITGRFDSIIGSFTNLENEFSQMRQITKSYKLQRSIEDGDIGKNITMKANLSWATLHSLLHSDRIPCRWNGYIWLGDLLVSEISEERSTSVSANIRNLQQQIALAGLKDPSTPDIPLSIWIFCGLLKSKNNMIRGGFLFVLEKLLMRCKLLLDENELEHSTNTAEDVHDDNCLEKANLVIDIMSCSLSLVTQINETDHFNILKMCDILFSQLCLKVPPATPVASGSLRRLSRRSGSMDDPAENVPQQEYIHPQIENIDDIYNSVCETSSMAALLLQGQAIAPIHLVARVPAVLFYWPLFQLAGAATDNIALGVSVGSRGSGNLPGATSDIRAALLLLLIAKCAADPTSFQEVDGEDFFRQLLDDTDSRVAYISSAFLLKRMMTEDFSQYQHLLQNLVLRAQQSNNEKLLENPYLQMRGILHLSNDLGTGL
ncbi:hypothetical protein Nepgr_009777 [Nepenthes gracilis]|uniref:Uncharacterized protein n=1 Tax=Nepenthes gracilis TaxID=150966 RepID=A0AAD3SC05_NEPGR|nr:hypothetical protein Nepgr_009777 [Nepenthes gracilis]